MRGLVQVASGAPELGGVILDALDMAIRHERWEVADRLLLALEALAEGSGDEASRGVHEAVAKIIGGGADA